MRMKKFVRNPVDYQNAQQAEELDRELARAAHVETYTKDEGRFGGDRTIVIFAFYPDNPKELTIAAECIGCEYHPCDCIPGNHADYCPIRN